MWQELLVALGLVLVIEGILPATSPRAFRRAVSSIAMLADRHVRLWGLACLLGGALLVHLAR